MFVFVRALRLEVEQASSVTAIVLRRAVDAGLLAGLRAGAVGPVVLALLHDEPPPDEHCFHDLGRVGFALPRHYFASLLIASGADVKVVQRRLRHASAMTTLNTYGHMWPDADESARAAVGVVLAARADSLAKRLAD